MNTMWTQFTYTKYCVHAITMTDLKHRKLALFLPNLDGGGAERTMLNLAQGIARRGFHVDLVLAQADGAYLEDVPDSIRLVDLARGRVVHRFKTLRRLAALVNYLRLEQPDVLLAALVEANVVALCARKLVGSPIRVVVNEQNTQSRRSANAPSGLQRWHPFFTKIAYRWADCVVGVSQGVVDDLVDNVGIAKKQTKVIYNPGITREVRDKARAQPDHPWFDPGQPPVVLAVGRLSKQKDYKTLLHAFAAVRQKRAARLLILGDGEERQSLEAMIRELGIEEDVALPGFVNNPYAFMSQAAAFALSSRWEGLPTVLVEALYCGVPVVATDCPSGPNEILLGGKLGCLVPLQDPAALAIGIENALDGKIPQSDSDSWRRFELESIVDQYIDLLFTPASQDNLTCLEKSHDV